MPLQLAGFGTCLPPLAVAREQALAFARKISPKSPKHLLLLDAIYDGCGINTWHSSIEESLLTDVLTGSRTSGSVFLPRHEEDTRGPTTKQRMGEFQKAAGKLLAGAARN